LAAYQLVKSLDPNHPLVLIEAPVVNPDYTPLTAAAVEPFTPATDVHGVDIYPIPPGAHSPHDPNKDISIVGDVTAIIAQASPNKSVWTTLQIAWSGTPSPPVLPSLPQARFMAYDAIVAGARGLPFFGGDVVRAMTPADAETGWNWTHWQNVQRPLLSELTDSDHALALIAPAAAGITITANAADISLSAREAGGFLYLIAVRRSPTLTAHVRFSGFPAGVTRGVVLAHPGNNPARNVAVASGAFTDPSPFAPHNARVYRFHLPANT
jgi:hypothetical protein